MLEFRLASTFQMFFLTAVLIMFWCAKGVGTCVVFVHPLGGIKMTLLRRSYGVRLAFMFLYRVQKISNSVQNLLEPCSSQTLYFTATFSDI